MEDGMIRCAFGHGLSFLILCRLFLVCFDRMCFYVGHCKGGVELSIVLVGFFCGALVRRPFCMLEETIALQNPPQNSLQNRRAFVEPLPRWGDF